MIADMTGRHKSGGRVRGVNMTGVMSPGSSRALRLDPHHLPVRYAARDNGADGQVRDIELDRERVVLKREVRGIRMKIGVPLNEFAGVTMRTLPPEGEEPAAVAIMLEHRDNGLTVPLFEIGRAHV